MQLNAVRDLLLSPCCWASLELEQGEVRSGGSVLWTGTWRCTRCRKEFPQAEGMAFLGVIDQDWTATLGESIARRKIVQKEIDELGWETGRREQLDHQIAQNTELMDALFRAALDEAAPGPGMRVLDVGAGLCATSAEFARRGAAVVACETETAHLLYTSFEETDPGPPECVTNSQRSFYWKNPQKHAHYLSRIVAPVYRLPFQSGSYDVVFCRSVLHHLGDLTRAVREMLRVLKPGGVFVACSEPMRSVLDREDHHLLGIMEKEEGMNELRPRLPDYLRALRGCAAQPVVQSWPMPHQFESKRFFDLIPYNFHKHLPPGERVNGMKLFKLYPISASINIYARRNEQFIPTPPAGRDTVEGFTTSTLAQVHCLPGLVEALERCREGTEIMSAGWRQLLALDGGLKPVFEPGVAAERELYIGWRRRLVRDGVAFRHVNRHATVVLSRLAGAKCIHLEIAAALPAAGKPQITCAGKVFVNGRPVGDFSMQPHVWETREFALPPDDGSGAVEIELFHETMVFSADEGGDPAELGLAVRRIRCL
ncbi:MAG: class I SAM-dependent methyltransferase [Candidatus Sumerlaeaceae bacterium]|nr:class I SAM-dependent methyltransferase [Candidatus Sumerlaeaceae bacterium]